MKVRLSDIIDAIDFTNRETEYFLDAKTGEVIYISPVVMTSSEMEALYDQLDEHGFYRLPSSFEINDYNVMEAFIAGLPEKPRERLSSAIQGRGAFSRFKNEIYKIGLDKAWYQFQEDTHRRKAIRWCEENGIEYYE